MIRSVAKNAHEAVGHMLIQSCDARGRVVPAKAGTQIITVLDSRLRGNDNVLNGESQERSTPKNLARPSTDAHQLNM